MKSPMPLRRYLLLRLGLVATLPVILVAALLWGYLVPKMHADIGLHHQALARTVAETCRDAGIAIPQQLAILGANDDPLVCKMTNPHLSSIGIPWAKVGYEVGARMEALLRDRRTTSSGSLQPKRLIAS